MKNSGGVFQFKPFSLKQRKILSWWMPESPVNDKDGIIADGAIRSGKSLSMSFSFIIWAMECFDGQQFAMCGKSVGSFRRNVLVWLKLMLRGRGYKLYDKRSDNLVVITKNGKENTFYIFGGRDERSQDFVQGATFAGVFLDEVALMPESFVNQVTGRCSVDGSKMWFNCNPSYPSHWFKTEWIDKADEKNFLYLHFTMDDNLSLSEKIKARYRSMYAGVFYKRYILGLWALAEGIIYPMYQDAIENPPEDYTPIDLRVSVDYGTMNAFGALLWGKHENVWYATKGYYYSGRDSGITKTDEEYAEELDKLVSSIMTEREARFMREQQMGYYPTFNPIKVIVDPSAASFISVLRKRKHGQFKWYKVIPADNAVIDGIRETATAMQKGLIKISPSIEEWRKEAEGYVWDEKSGDDKPLKVNDHYMDSTRYFVKTEKVSIIKEQYKPLWN